MWNKIVKGIRGIWIASLARGTKILEVKTGEHTISQLSQFRYLGFIIQNEEEIEGDVNHWIQAPCMKWRNTLGVICDKAPLKFKGKFQCTSIKIGIECEVVKSQQQSKLNVAKMKVP